MSKKATQMVEKIEHQLAQVILYLGAIDALSEMYRSCETQQHDPFLFRTVYESLWDGVIVRIGTIWDKSKNVGSLPQLSVELKRLKTTAALSAAKKIDKAESDERRRVREWRHLVVAHSSLALDPENFDMKNGISANDVRSEADRPFTMAFSKKMLWQMLVALWASGSEMSPNKRLVPTHTGEAPVFAAQPQR